MRRVLLLNALIFAVLAAAAALAYRSFSYTSEDRSRDRELALMQDLADEKVLNLESQIADTDTKLLRSIEIDPISDVKALLQSTGSVRSVIVLDERLAPVPGLYWGPPDRSAKDGKLFLEYFLTRILPELEVQKQPAGERVHRYLRAGRPGEPPGLWYLFSYMRRVSGDKTFYVVIEDDPIHFSTRMFPLYFFAKDEKRLYQVVDEYDEVVYGAEFANTPGELVVERPFYETLDGWKLRVAAKDFETSSELRRQRVLDSILIGGTSAIILGGLVVLGFAIRRERRLNELKSEFISNISHELKTPLSIISMFGEMLALGRTKSPEQATEYAKTIYSESVRLGRLIDNVLDFSKIERGMGSYEFADSDPGEVIERALELSQRRVAAAEMTLETDIAEELPTVQLDANAYTLAVLNLIDNAIKYAADGKKIRLSLTREGDNLVLAVRDWGPGIDPEEHERIFERFYRAKSIRLKPIRGSGIGLALVQHIARAHRGEASVRSAPGEGSTFSISIPVGGKN